MNMSSVWRLCTPGEVAIGHHWSRRKGWKRAVLMDERLDSLVVVFAIVEMGEAFMSGLYCDWGYSGCAVGKRKRSVPPLLAMLLLIYKVLKAGEAPDVEHKFTLPRVKYLQTCLFRVLMFVVPCITSSRAYAWIISIKKHQHPIVWIHFLNGT